MAFLSGNNFSRQTPGASMPLHQNGLHDNFNVESVLVYRFADTRKSNCPNSTTLSDDSNRAAKAEASRCFRSLMQALARVGLAIEVRNGENCSLLVLVKVASDEHLNNAIYRSR